MELIRNLNVINNKQKENEMKQVKEMTISENKKRGTKMIVVHTVVKGKENRCKKPFIISETKHVGR